jgi:hypothetical protein
MHSTLEVKGHPGHLPHIRISNNVEFVEVLEHSKILSLFVSLTTIRGQRTFEAGILELNAAFIINLAVLLTSAVTITIRTIIRQVHC